MVQTRGTAYVFGEIPVRNTDYDFSDSGVPPVVGGGTHVLLDSLQVPLNGSDQLPLDTLVISQSGGGIPLDTLTIAVQS